MAQAQLSDERAKLTNFDDELQALETASRSKSALITEANLSAQKLAHQIERFQKDQSAAAHAVAAMETEHDWIADEKDNFARPHSAYDLKGQNIAECRSGLRNLSERFQGLRKKINPKVMATIDAVEKKEAALRAMMKTVVRDKRKIEETIGSLDEYKKEALRKTWVRVDGDFGNIFAELLPGSFARLEPVRGGGGEVGEGLEVRVCLGKVWKESLAELSGGQRCVWSAFLTLGHCGLDGRSFAAFVVAPSP